MTIPGHEISVSLLASGGSDAESVSMANVYSKRALSQPLTLNGCMDAKCTQVSNDVGRNNSICFGVFMAKNVTCKNTNDVYRFLLAFVYPRKTWSSILFASHHEFRIAGIPNLSIIILTCKPCRRSTIQ